MATHYWAFTLSDCARVCLWVGRTTHHPTRIARSYVTTRPWGVEIDMETLRFEHFATLDQAKKVEREWINRFLPLYRTAAPSVPRAPLREFSTAERAEIAQARHRELTKDPLGRPLPPRQYWVYLQREGDVLLYVGSTMRTPASRRYREHSWARRATDVEVRECANYEEMCALEIQLIHEHRPELNMHWAPRGAQRGQKKPKPPVKKSQPVAKKKRTPAKVPSLLDGLAAAQARSRARKAQGG